LGESSEEAEEPRSEVGSVELSGREREEVEGLMAAVFK
jgi:hypothetical protein